MKKSLVSLLLCLAAAPALAVPTGWYAGAGVGKVSTDYDAGNVGVTSTTAIVSTVKSDEKEYGGRLFLGHGITNGLGLEAGLATLGSTDLESISGITGADVDIDHMAADVVAKIIYPFTEQLQLYAKLGAAYLRNDDDVSSVAKSNFFTSKTDDTISVAWGVGGEVMLTAHTSLSGEWLRYQGRSDAEDIDLASINLTYYLS